MANWYTNTKTKKIKDTGKTVFETTLPPKIEKSANDEYIIARLGDRLDTLADKRYNDPSLWRIIAQANNLGKGSLAIPVGMQIRIPFNPDEVLAELKKQNDER